jgi:transposase
MAAQLTLAFNDVPVSCPIQEKYHAIAPVLAGHRSIREQAHLLGESYDTVRRWLDRFRADGMRGLFPTTSFPRGPYTPERVAVTVLFFKCCAPSVSDREMARVVSVTTGHRIHHSTIGELLRRYAFWKHPEFRITYPVSPEPEARRAEMVRLRRQGWSEKTVARLLGCRRKTVRKWVRRFEEELEAGLASRPSGTRSPERKVTFGTIHAVLQLQRKYGYAGWFRIKGYLERDYGISIGQTTLKKVMQLNRRLHLAPRPPRPEPREPREGPPECRYPFEHTFIDLRYIDGKPEGVQLYSCLLLDGLSRTILAGSLTRQQDVGIVLRIYYLALLNWGCWENVTSDHGGQFQSHGFARVNERLGIRHTMYDKGHPWENLIEAQFGIQRRLGEYRWERCKTIEEAVEFHAELMRDHNRLPHFAHHKRNDGKHAPIEVLGETRGRRVEPADLHDAFSRKVWKRMVDAHGFIRVNRWRIYVEQGLARTPIQVTLWDGKLRAGYQNQKLAEYECAFDERARRPTSITRPTFHEHPFGSPQPELFDPLWVRDPQEQAPPKPRMMKAAAGGEQMHFRFRPELVR